MKTIMQCVLFIASILVFGVLGANAQSGNTSAPITDKWAALNSTCRSDPPDWLSTRKACEERNAITIQLDAAGLCYVNPPGHWQKCGTQQRNPTGSIAQILVAGPLRNSNLAAVRVAPSTAAKAVNDWHGETAEDFLKFFARNTKESEKKDPLKPLTNLLGLLGGGGDELIWTFAFQGAYNPTVQWFADTFAGEKNEVGDDTWVHRCINVSTSSFPKSAKLKRRLNGSSAPGQLVALRIVTVFGLEAGALDKLDRKDLDSKLTAVTGSQYAKVFFMAGETNDKSEIVFSNVRSADGTDRSADIKTLIVPKSISNGALERTLSNLQKDCPNKWE